MEKEINEKKLREERIKIYEEMEKFLEEEQANFIYLKEDYKPEFNEHVIYKDDLTTDCELVNDALDQLGEYYKKLAENEPDWYDPAYESEIIVD